MAPSGAYRGAGSGLNWLRTHEKAMNCGVSKERQDSCLPFLPGLFPSGNGTLTGSVQDVLHGAPNRPFRVSLQFCDKNGLPFRQLEKSWKESRAYSGDASVSLTVNVG